MNLKSDLLFCGNASLDTIICNNGTQIVIGGSSCNSAISAALNTKKQISLFTSLGSDFPIQKLRHLNIDTKNIDLYDVPSNAFVVDEIENTISLKQPQYLPIKIPNDIKTSHLHVSCRRGVPFKEMFTEIQA